MLDLNLIRNDAKKVSEALAKKGYEVDFSELLEWDKTRKSAKQNVEALKA
ncbi:MAG: serine--tRNA ligase, partial [Clostridia bacterium]|nr:serine--tRNA ligase [Clostridia bacterium]